MMPPISSGKENDYIIWTLKNLEEKIGSTSRKIVLTISKKLGLEPYKIRPLVERALNRCIVFGEIKKKGNNFRLQPLEAYNQYLKRQAYHEKMNKEKRSKSGKTRHAIAQLNFRKNHNTKVIEKSRSNQLRKRKESLV